MLFRSAVRELDQRFEVLARFGGAYNTIQGRLDHELWRLSMLRTKLFQATADVESGLPHKFIVNRALPADKKAYPVRWFVTLISATSAFLLALLVVMVRQNVRKFRSANG